MTRTRTVLATASVLVIASAVLAACGGGGSSGTSTTSAGKPATTTTTAPPVAPLTGLPDPSGAARARAALSVKIENSPESRPQTGLDQADVVWEEVVEGQITRFLAMFNSQSPATLGPIRSVRLTDPNIVWPVGGIFAFSGGAKYALDGIKKAPVVLVDESRAGSAMYRERSRRAPHNLYGRGDALFQKGGSPVPPPALFTYTSKRPGTTTPGTQAALSARVGFNGSYAVDWTWDAGRRAWLRSTSGRPFTVASGAQVSATNVVIMAITYRGGPGAMQAEGIMTGEGRAIVLTDGLAIEGRWIRPDQSTPARFVDGAGRTIALTPGNTWVELPDVSYPLAVTPAPVPAPTTKP
ncbi:MAG: DUF3048 domain-containing protein [Actinomycetes bacterium]